MTTDTQTTMVSPARARSTVWLPAASLWWREVLRFFRQRSRIIGAFGSPLLFWVLLGSGLGSSFHSPEAPAGMGYLEYFFPGTVALILMFTAIFSTISVIEDRREGFLQAVLAAPVPRSSIVLGKVLGGTTLAVIQGMLFLALAPMAGIHLSVLGVLTSFIVMCVVGFGLTALGFLLAWQLNSTQGFHAIMNLLLIPMWLLSGAAFPVSGSAGWIGWVMRVNPLTYGVNALRHSIYLGQAEPQAQAAGGFAMGLGSSLLLSLVFAAIAFAGVVFVARQRRAADSMT